MTDSSPAPYCYCHKGGSMRIVSSLVIVTAVLASSSFIGGAQTQTQTPNVSKVIDTYCSGCHNGSMTSPSGALLDRFDTAQISANPDVWSRAYRQLQAGTMPPVGAARPVRATYDDVLASIEQAFGETAKPTATADEPGDRLTTCNPPLERSARCVVAGRRAEQPVDRTRHARTPDSPNARGRSR